MSPLIARGEGAWLETDRRHAHPGRDFLLVGDHPWPSPSQDRGRDQGSRPTQLDQVIFAGFTHQPAEDLARGLVEIAPHRPRACLLFRQRFDRGGSGAENGAGLLAQRGKPRSRIIALEHAYHGDTIGAMAAGARGVFNAAYEPLLFDVERLPFPAPGREQRNAGRAGTAGAQAPPP